MQAGQIHLSEGEGVEYTLSPNTQKAYLSDLFSANNAALKADMVRNLDPDEVAQFNEEFDELTSLISSLTPSLRNSLFDMVSLNDLDLDGLRQLAIDSNVVKEDSNQLQNLVSLRTGNRATDSKFSAVDDKLASENPDIRTLLSERNTLLNAVTLSPEQAARLDSVSKQVGSLKEFVELRNAKETQENLKQRITQIEQAASSKENDALKIKALADLNELKRNIDRYLLRDVKDTTKVPDVQKSDSAVSEGLMNSLVISRGVVDSRIGGFSAVSAGDLMQTYGVWAQGSMSRGTQKSVW